MKYLPKHQLKSYDDEDQFTIDVVIPLFETLAFSNKLHAAHFGLWYWGKDKRNEGLHGIDVLFGFNDFLGNARHIAILCKVIPVTMGVNSSKSTSIMTIQHQIQLAWGHKFISPLNHKQSCINELILLTNKDISQDVWEYTWELEVNKYRNTYLWDLNKVNSMVKKLSKINYEI